MRDQRDIWKKLSEGERHLSVLFVVCSLCSALLFTVKPVQAYMQEETCSVNHFSFAHIRTLSAELTEPAWRTEAGQYFLPGQETAKDPQIKNTSTDGTDELVALRVTFVYQDTCPDEEKRGKPLTDDDMHMLSGILDIDFARDKIDMLSLSAHKFHGPKGIGALLVKAHADTVRLIPGGGQEQGRRGGTEAAKWVKAQAADTLQHFSPAALSDLDRQFIRRNISPGGSADMLSLTIFIHLLTAQA